MNGLRGFYYPTLASIRYAHSSAQCSQIVYLNQLYRSNLCVPSPITIPNKLPPQPLHRLRHNPTPHLRLLLPPRHILLLLSLPRNLPNLLPPIPLLRIPSLQLPNPRVPLINRLPLLQNLLILFPEYTVGVVVEGSSDHGDDGEELAVETHAEHALGVVGVAGADGFCGAPEGPAGYCAAWKGGFRCKPRK